MTTSPLLREILDLTKDLIRIPSTGSQPGEIDRCADFIGSWLKKNKITFEKEVHNSTPSILVMPQPRQSPILLMAHFDVVEADNGGQFSPFEQDGRLYGRGAVDDKYGVALSLVLFREQLHRHRKAGRSQEDIGFGLLFTGDEELGGADGAGKVSASLDTDFFIALDGGRPDHIVTKEKGILALDLTANGKSAHAARPWLGRSAFDILVEDYLKIKTLFSENSPDNWHRTAVLANCHCGNGATNVVPERAAATLNIRYTENDNPNELLAEIRELCTSEVSLQAMEPVFESSPSPYLDQLLRHAAGADVGFEHGASDARYLSGKNIPGAIWGADGEMSQHTENEHVVISSIESIYRGLDSFLCEIGDKSGKML